MVNRNVASRRRGKLPDGNPDPVDVHVGGRLRLRRTLIGMSKEQLAAALNITFQQVQKYERGANRVGSSRLFQLSRVLDVPVSYFFEEMSADTAMRAKQAASDVGGLAEDPGEGYQADPMTKRETLELVRAYYRITDPKLRRRLFDMTKALAAASQTKS